jgi:hypothetical protein
LVRYYYAWKWGRLLLLSGWQKNNWQPQRNAHTHTHKVENGVLRVLYIHVQYWRG